MTIGELVNLQHNSFPGVYSGEIVAYNENDESCTVKLGERRITRVGYNHSGYEFKCWPIPLEEIT